MQKINLAGRLDEIVGLLAEIRDRLCTTCPSPCSQLRGCVAGTKEEKEPSPRTPHKEKEETNNNDSSRTCARARFVKPTVEEVAAYIREKGYSFDAAAFWNYYESNGWRVGRNPMKSWKSACVTWQRQEVQTAAAATRAVRHRPDNWIGCSDAERKEFVDGLA